MAQEYVLNGGMPELSKINNVNYFPSRRRSARCSYGLRNRKLRAPIIKGTTNLSPLLVPIVDITYKRSSLTTAAAMYIPVLCHFLFTLPIDTIHLDMSSYRLIRALNTQS